jgi:Pol polyprotein, beta-barrel domain
MMSTLSTVPETSAVHLRTTKDWPRYIALVRTRALQKAVWDVIDPDREPTQLNEPPEPTPKKANGEVTTIAALTPAELEAYKIERDDWKAKKKLYDKKKEVLNDIEDYVIRTTGNFWSTIERVDGLRAKLVALKNRVAPTNYARELDALRRWERANQGAKSTRTEEWIAEWEAALTEAQLHNLPDVQGIRPTRQFIRAVEGIAPSFTTHWTNHIETIGVTQPTQKLEDVIPSGFQIATIFRNQFRTNSRGQKGAFPSTLQNDAAPGQSQSEKRKCFDGIGHSMDRCFYLHSNIRPEGWVMRRKSAQSVLKGLKKDSALQERFKEVVSEIEAFLNKNTSETSTSKQPAQEDDNRPVGTAFTGMPNSSFASSTDVYPLFDSWIFDSGSGHHIANKRERFRPGTLHDLDFPEEIFCGDTSAWITAYGEADCEVSTPTGKRNFRLTHVAFVENFHVNIVSHKRMREAGYRWDDVALVIEQDNKTICSMTERFGQYVLSYQPLVAVFASSRDPRPIRDADAKGWHLRCGHLGKEALEKLISATYGVRIRGQLTLECEDCIQAKAKQHVSRRPSNNRSPRPLWRISIDLFELSMSMTGMVRALVIQDEYSGEIWLYTLPDKSQDSVLGALKSFSCMVQTQWNLKICRIRRDNEAALGNQYDDWLSDEGIQDEPTPVYTPAENPRAERSGGVIRAKALAMQLGARFPTELWHEFWQAAAYLHNRSPREVNAWKSPIEVRNKWLRQSGRDVPEVQDPPDLSNLWAYGCRAYPLRERIRAGKDAVENRTKPRTHIG